MSATAANSTPLDVQLASLHVQLVELRAAVAALAAAMPLSIGHMTELAKLQEVLAKRARKSVDPDDDLATRIALLVSEDLAEQMAPLMALGAKFLGVNLPVSAPT